MNLCINTAAPQEQTPALGMLRAIVCLACASSAHAFVAAPPPTRPALTASARRAASPRALLEVAPPSFNLALGSIALGGVFGVPGSPLKNKVTAFVPGALLALFGLFIAFQTATLRFTFDDKEFSLVKADLSSTGENVVVGGENRWAYDKFVNYDFFPSESFPILVCALSAAAPSAPTQRLRLPAQHRRPPIRSPCAHSEGCAVRARRALRRLQGDADARGPVGRRPGRAGQQRRGARQGGQARAGAAAAFSTRAGAWPLPHLPDRHATRYVAQVHFFPAISNVAYLKDGFVKHSCAKLP